MLRFSGRASLSCRAEVWLPCYPFRTPPLEVRGSASGIASPLQPARMKWRAGREASSVPRDCSLTWHGKSPCLSRVCSQRQPLPPPLPFPYQDREILQRTFPQRKLRQTSPAAREPRFYIFIPRRVNISVWPLHPGEAKYLPTVSVGRTGRNWDFNAYSCLRGSGMRARWPILWERAVIIDIGHFLYPRPGFYNVWDRSIFSNVTPMVIFLFLMNWPANTKWRL